MAELIRLGRYLPGGWSLDGEPQALYFTHSKAEELRRTDPNGGPFFDIPQKEFRGHAIVVGQSGSGKTQSLLRLVWEVARKWRWQVVVVDAKADTALQEDLARVARGLTQTFGVFPHEGYDLWRGEPIDIATRLMELVPISPADQPLSHHIVTRAVTGQVDSAHSATAFLNNLGTIRPAAGHQGEIQRSLLQEYGAVFSSAAGALLSGAKGIADCDISYIAIDALRYPYAAAGTAAAILRDIADFVVRRPERDTGRTLLLVFDEFSAAPVDVATDLIERIRSFNVQLVLGVQSFAGLGPHADRLLEATNWLWLHRTSSPEAFTRVIGDYVDGSRRPLIDPLSIRRLENGQMFVTWRSRVAKVAIEVWPSSQP